MLQVSAWKKEREKNISLSWGAERKKNKLHIEISVFCLHYMYSYAVGACRLRCPQSLYFKTISVNLLVLFHLGRHPVLAGQAIPYLEFTATQILQQLCKFTGQKD